MVIDMTDTFCSTSFVSYFISYSLISLLHYFHSGCINLYSFATITITLVSFVPFFLASLYIVVPLNNRPSISQFNHYSVHWFHRYPAPFLNAVLLLPLFVIELLLLLLVLLFPLLTSLLLLPFSSCISCCCCC